MPGRSGSTRSTSRTTACGSSSPASGASRAASSATATRSTPSSKTRATSTPTSSSCASAPSSTCGAAPAETHRRIGNHAEDRPGLRRLHRPSVRCWATGGQRARALRIRQRGARAPALGAAAGRPLHLGRDRRDPQEGGGHPPRQRDRLRHRRTARYALRTRTTGARRAAPPSPCCSPPSATSCRSIPPRWRAPSATPATGCSRCPSCRRYSTSPAAAWRNRWRSSQPARRLRAPVPRLRDIRILVGRARPDRAQHSCAAP